MLIDGQPIRVPGTVERIRAKLAEQRTWYAENGNFPDADARDRLLSLFEQAINLIEASRN